MRRPAHFPVSISPSSARQSAATAWALTWRGLVAVGVGGGYAMLLVALVLAAVGVLPRPTAAVSAGTALGLAMVPALGLLLATVVGLTAAVSGVALVVRNHLDARARHAADRPASGRRRDLRLARSLRTALRSAPRVVLACAVGALLVAVLVAAAPVLVVVAVAVAAWRAVRDKTPWRQTLWSWGWAVPFAPAAAAAAAIPAVYASVLNGASLAEAVRAARRSSLRGRAIAFTGLVAVIAAGGLLAQIALAGKIVGGTTFDAAIVASLIVAGAALGALAHQGSSADDATPHGTGVAPRRGAPTGGSWRLAVRRARLSRVARVTAVSLVAPMLALGATVGPATAAHAATDVVVDTAADTSTTVDPDQCRTADVPCGLRAAIAYAGEQAAADGSTVTVTFASDTTIRLAGTLRVPSGVDIDGGNNTVTIDAQHGFRAIEAYSTGGEGPRLSLKHLRVTGGRSTSGGAGLYSGDVGVSLLETTWDDNVSGGAGGGAGTSRDGGAVAVPANMLRVEDSTFVDDHATAGAGGAMAADRLIVTNTTITRSTGASGRPEGGALFAASVGMVTHATVTAGGGMAGSSGAPLQVVNSLVSAVAGSTACAQVTSSDPAEGSPSVGNVDPDGTCNGLAADPVPLAALADNGGPTQTIALEAGNPAIAAGSTDFCAYADQRGTGRDAQHCDAGAFQLSQPAPPPSTVVTLSGDRYGFTHSTAGLYVSATRDGTGQPGSVELLEDGARVAGPFVIDPRLDKMPLSFDAPAQGPHQLVARFTPDDGGPDVDSEPFTFCAVSLSRAVLSTAEPAALGGPATITATITDAPDIGEAWVAEPGTPVRTGSATITVDGVDHEVALVNGAATVHVDNLQSATVTVFYSGDDYYYPTDTFAPSSWTANITSVDISTTTTADVVRAEYGQPLSVVATVNDASGPAVGTVTLHLDGAAVDTQTLASGQATLTAPAPAGDHQLYVEYTPTAGRAMSQSAPVTVHVAPGRTSVAITSAEPTATYPAQPVVAFDATGTGAADVQLKDADTVVATAHVTLPATGQFTLPAGTLSAGPHHLHAEVVPSATAAGSSSDPLDVTLTTGAATVTATAGADATVGTPTTVELRSDVSARTTYTITRDTDGGVVDVVHSADGTASFDYTPLVSDVALTVTATFDDGNFGTAVAHVAITASKADAPAPTMTWHNPGPDFDAAPPYLTVTLPTKTGLAAPTGQVQLLGPQASGGLSDVIGYGELVDGTVKVAYIGAPGVCYCGARTPRLRYVGDDSYQGFELPAPEVDVPAIATTTTLDGVPATVRPGYQLLLQAHVQGTSRGFPSGRIEFVTNGLVVASRDLVSGSVGTYWTVPWSLGDHAEVRARYVPDSATWKPSSASQTATVLYPQPPTVTLDAPAPLKVGDWGHVAVQVEQFDQFIDRGSLVKVTDGAGNVLGTATWWGSSSAGVAAPLDILVKPVRGGAAKLSVHYLYNNGTAGTSAPLATTVAGVTTRLSVTADAAPVAGFPFTVRVALSSLPPGVQPGVVPVRLYADGVPFGATQYAFSTGGGPPSATFYGVVAKRGFVSLTASTPGDGADLGAGDGGTTVLVAGAPLHLSARDGLRYDATFGKALTITPQFSWGATTGSGPTDGRLTVAVVGADGASRTCEAQLPSLTCTIPAYAVPAPGTYTVRVSYSGGSFYADTPDAGPGNGSGGTDVGDLVVTGTRSTLSTSFDRNPLTWVVGQKVTATFDVADPLDDALLATGVVSLRNGENVLCSTVVSHARRATCAFTVPDPHLPLAQQKPSDLVGTFTPAGASLPGTSWAQLGSVPRCFLVTSTYGNMPGARHVPSLSGRTCDTAGATAGRPGTMPGFIEGSAVDVTLVDPVTTGWKYTGSQLNPADGSESQQLLASGTTVTVWNLSQDVTVTPQYVWAPTCVTVVTGFETPLSSVGMTLAQWRNANRGKPDPANGLRLLTPSNCDLPHGSSAREVADLADGIGHYVVGTPLMGERTHPGPDAAPQKVQWDLTEVPGGTAPTARSLFWRATASGPTSGNVQIVFGRFRWSDQMCRTVQLEAGDGGTLSVTRSRFPTAWSEFDDPSGSCTTSTGQHGYLAGTDVEVTARPWSQTTGTRVKDKPNYYLYRWLTADDLKGSGTDPYAAAFQPRWALVAKARTEVPGVAGGITGDPFAAHSTSRTLPFDDSPTVVGAEFGVLSCVPVIVNLHGFPSSTRVNMTATTCPGITPDNDGSQGAHRGTAVSYYAYKTHVDVSTDAPGSVDGKAMSWTGRYAGGQWSWENKTSASIEVPYALDGVTLDASYYDTLCYKRQDGLEQVDADGYGSQVNADSRCLPGWTAKSTSQRAIIPAAAQANHVKAQWAVFAERDRFQAADDEILNRDPRTGTVGYPAYVVSNGISYSDLDKSYTTGGKTVPVYYQTRVDLRFCRDLSDVVTTKLVDPSGRPISGGGGEFGHAPAAKDLMKTYSSCYGLATQPGTKDAVLMTSEAQKKWTLLAWRNVTTGRLQLNTPQSYGMAYLSSTKDGVVSTQWEAVVTPRCYTLDYSERVNVNTAPNCAGVDPALRMYNPGTVVHLSWDSGHDDTWRGWDGASGSQDDGTVVMDQDRTVRATWTHDDNFKTNILEPLSNAAQRVVGAIVTGFNSWLLQPAAAVLSVVQKVATVCNLVASGLEMLGVHGAAVDGLRSVSAAIGTSIDMLNALGSCTVQWATGNANAMTPTTTEGKAARAAAGAIAQKVSNSVGNDWMKDAQVGGDLITLFAGNLDAFSQDPAEAWSSITGIGSCLQQKGEAAAASFSG